MKSSPRRDADKKKRPCRKAGPSFAIVRFAYWLADAEPEAEPDAVPDADAAPEAEPVAVAEPDFLSQATVPIPKARAIMATMNKRMSSNSIRVES